MLGFFSPFSFYDPWIKAALSIGQLVATSPPFHLIMDKKTSQYLKRRVLFGILYDGIVPKLSNPTYNITTSEPFTI